MIRRPPRSTLDRSSAASDVYKRQLHWCRERLPAAASGVQFVADVFGQSETGREAGRFDAEQVDEAGQAVRGMRLDEKVGLPLARSGELRPNAGIGRLQGAVRQARPVLAHLSIEPVSYTHLTLPTSDLV